MHYVIDGYNLFFQSEDEINPLEITRKNFIEALNETLDSLHLHATLIFDSHQEVASFYPSKKALSAVDIIFSPQGLSADDYILERLLADQKPQSHILVTSDKKLSEKAKHLGAKTKSSKAFFEMLTTRKAKKDRQKETKLEVESSMHFKRLLTEFEKRLRDESSD